jgi:hypothetical protein
MKNYEVSNMKDVCQIWQEDMACYGPTGIGVTYTRQRYRISTCADCWLMHSRHRREDSTS